MLKKLKWTLLSLSLLLLAGIGYYTYAFMSFANNIQAKPGAVSKLPSALSTQNLSKNVETNLPPKWEGKQRVNLLILGGDSRGMKQNEVPRSDSLIVASIDPVTKKAHLFSIMRDTYVKIPGYGEDRINAAYALGGPNLTMKTVSDLLGIPIQYYVYTDFKGFIALVDAIDGIEMDVEKDMKYSDSEDGREYDINLKKGLQHLDGKMALQYVRFRHDALSDFSRTERQRNFIQVVVKKMQTTSSLLKLPWILSSIDPYIETNLSTTDMIKLGSLGYEAKTEGMTSQQIPPSELLQEKKVGGADVIGVNREKLQSFIQALLEKQDPNSVDPNETINNSRDSGIEAGSGNGTSSGAANQPASNFGSMSKPPVIVTPKPTSTSKPATVVNPASTNRPASSAASKPASSTTSGSTSGTPGKPSGGAAANSASKPAGGTTSGSTSGMAGKPAAGTATDSTSKPTSSTTSGSINKPVTETTTNNSSSKPLTAGKPATGAAAEGTSKSASDQPATSVTKPVTGGTSTDSISKPASSPASSKETKPATGAGPKLEAESTETKPAATR